MKESGELEPKKVKIPYNESPLKLPVKPDKGTTNLYTLYLNVKYWLYVLVNEPFVVSVSHYFLCHLCCLL